MDSASWLLPDGTDRTRLLDMDRRLRPARRMAFGFTGAALLLSGPWLGWWTVAPLVVSALFFAVSDRYIDRMERPEYWTFALWGLSSATIAAAVALTGGPSAPMMCWLVIPVITLGARFSLRGTLAGLIFTAVLMVGVAFASDAHEVVTNPPTLLAPMAALLAIGSLLIPLMRSDRQHRTDAVIDQLTGMLNRKALDTRVTELMAQAQVTGERVSVVVGDIDRFKSFNDDHGHETGDAVLRDVAYTLRKHLRAFDLAYRLGGEEFLVLLPGADETDARVIAEELRATVADTDYAGGLHVTMSFGVATSARGEDFDYDAVFRSADEALYEAKAAGRDRVESASRALVAA